MSGPGDLSAEPVLVLRPGHGRMMESAYELTDQAGHVLAVGREPTLGRLGQVRRLTAEIHRDFRRVVAFGRPDGTPLFTVDKERYVHTRRTTVFDGQGMRVGRIDDASPVISKRYRLFGDDGRSCGLVEGRRGVLTVSVAEAQVGEMQWDRPSWTLRLDRVPAPEPFGTLVVAALVLAELTRGR